MRVDITKFSISCLAIIGLLLHTSCIASEGMPNAERPISDTSITDTLNPDAPHKDIQNAQATIIPFYIEGTIALASAEIELADEEVVYLYLELTGGRYQPERNPHYFENAGQATFSWRSIPIMRVRKSICFTPCRFSAAAQTISLIFW